MKSLLLAFSVDDSGQGLVEYSLILLLVSIAAITGLTLFGKKANNSLNSYGNAIPN